MAVEKDTLAKDLIEMLDAYDKATGEAWDRYQGAEGDELEEYGEQYENAKSEYLTNLMVYIKQRDAKVGDHWFKIGQANKRRNESPN